MVKIDGMLQLLSKFGVLVRKQKYIMRIYLLRCLYICTINSEETLMACIISVVNQRWCRKDNSNNESGGILRSAREKGLIVDLDHKEMPQVDIRYDKSFAQNQRYTTCL